MGGTAFVVVGGGPALLDCADGGGGGSCSCCCCCCWNVCCDGAPPESSLGVLLFPIILTLLRFFVTAVSLLVSRECVLSAHPLNYHRLLPTVEFAFSLLLDAEITSPWPQCIEVAVRRCRVLAYVAM